MNTHGMAKWLRSAGSGGLAFMAGLLLAAPVQSELLVNADTPGYYNDSLGTILDGTAPQFPNPYFSGGGDPSLYPADEPNLEAAASLLGDWLSPSPVLNDNWQFEEFIPATWDLNTETAILYPVIVAEPGVSNVVGDFDVDNGLFVWVNGQFKFGAVQPRQPSAIGLFEYTNVDLGSLPPGTNYIQILRQNNGIEANYQVWIRATDSIAPSITQHPTNQLVLAGYVARFNVAANGTEPLTYQWLFNGDTLADATNSSLVLSNAQPSRAGSYSVIVSNVAGVALSSNAVLTVEALPPVISAQPQNQSLYVGKTARFSVSVGGSAPLSFQWEKDERAIIGATNIVLTVSGVQLNDAGHYRVIVTNAFGNTKSLAATLAVQPAPACVPPPDGMVAWWPGEGNNWDVVNWVNGYDLSSYNLYAPYASGMVGTAFQFMQPGFLIAPDAAALNLGAGDGFTFESWINPNNVSGTWGILGWGGSIPGIPTSPTGVNLRIVAPGLLEAQLIRTNGQATFLRTQAPVVQAGQWQHVALSYDKLSGLAQIHVNGVAVAQTNIGPVGLQTTGRLRLGSGAGSGFYGLIDEPTLYSRALAQTELAAIFHADLSGKCPPPAPPCLEQAGIVAYWQGESNTVDIVGGNDGGVMPTNYPSALVYQPGVKGAAFDFNGANFISVPRSEGLDVGKAEGLTIEGWVYPQTSSGPIVEWTDTNSFGVYLAIGYTQSYALEANLIDTLGGSHFIRSSPQTVYSGWQHFGLTYDKASGIASLYKGGSLVATTNVGSFTPRTDTGMLIGYHPRYTGSPVYGAPPTSERMLQGGIDELAIYRRALGAAEIQQLSRLRPERCSDYPPEIGRQPQGTIVVEGGAVSFAVSAGGSQLLRFQWHHNGMPLAGAEDEVLSLTDVALSGAGDYSVIVANAFGAVTSRVARLEVLPTGQSLAVPSGAVAWWRGEGNGWDELGRSDAVWGVNMTPEYSAGIAGSAFHHNGSSTYLQVAANTNLDVGRGPGFTVEGWINPEAPSVGSVVDWNDVRGNVGVGIMINRTGLGTIEATLTDTNGIYSNERMVTFASALYAVASPTNQLPGWTHVALTFDKASSKATLLVNGLVVASRNLPAIRTVASPQFPVAFTPTTSGNLYFGYRPSGYNSGVRFRGGMDEFAVYDRSLSQIEVRSICLVGANGKLPPPPPPCLAPAAGIAAWWRGESNALDSVAGNHGEVMPTNYAVTQAYLPGRLNTGLAFRGQNYISVPRSDILDLGREDGLTIEAWVCPNQLRAMPIVEWTDSNSYGASLWLSYSRSPTVLEANLMDASGGLHVIYSPMGTVINNLWQHLAVTYDKASGLAVLYANGSPVTTTNLGSFTPRTDLPLMIGYHPPTSAYSGVVGSPPSGAFFFSGAMDEISAYRRALSPEEIDAIARSRPGKCLELPPEIGRQPQGAVLVEGGVASFAVTAGGSQPLQYQWRYSGIPIAGAVDEVLALTDVALSGAGDYSVIVANAFGAVTSQVARLEVLPDGQCLPVPAGAVAWWRGEGNGWDELGRSDAVWGVNMTPEYTAGMVDSAFHLNGSSAYLQVAANSNLDVGMGPGFTVEGWINPESMSPGPVVEWNDTRGNVGVGIVINQTGLGTIEATLTDTNGIYSNERMVKFASARNVVASPTNPWPGWTHVAFTFDKASGKATLLVNGRVVASRNLPAIRTFDSPQVPVAFTPTTSGNLYFGYRPSGFNSGLRFLGGVDEFAVYDRSLSPSEVRAIFLVGANGKCPPPPLPCLAPAAGIAGWWRGESNVMDSVAGNHGQVMSVGLPTNLAYSAGRFGSAFYLNGQNHFRVPASAALDLGLSEGITVEAWANPTQSRPMPIVEWNSGTGQQGVNLSYSFSRGPGVLEFNVVDTAGVSHQVFTPFFTAGYNQWVHVAATYDKASGLATVYYNGVAVSNRVVGTFTPRTGLDLFLGYRPHGAYVGGGNRFLGGIDEVAIYGRALTGDEIWSSYRSTHGKCTEPPLIVNQTGNIRVNVGDTAVLSVEALGNPVLHYQWFLSGGAPVPDDPERPNSITNSLKPSLAFADLSAPREGTYYCVVSNAFGVAVSSNATLLVNYPPVADAGATVRSLISPNGLNATVVLDGSRSSDPDDDELTYEWFVRGEASPLANGVVAVGSVPVGTNRLTLVVNDGLATGSQNFAVEVITTSEAVDRLARLVQSGDGSPQALLASLRAALASIDRSQPEVAINQLEAFKHKVVAQLMPVDPELAAQLIAAAQAIIDALSGDSGETAQSVRITSITRGTAGNSHLQIQGRAGRTLIIETSTDGVTWRKVGVAKDKGAEQYEFDDTGESWEMMRFYRVVSPK